MARHAMFIRKSYCSGRCMLCGESYVLGDPVASQNSSMLYHPACAIKKFKQQITKTEETIAFIHFKFQELTGQPLVEGGE